MQSFKDQGHAAVQRTPIKGLPDTPAPNRLAFGLSEAAPLIGVTRQTLAAAIKAGEIHAVRLGRRVLIPANELARFLRDGADRGAS